MYNFEKLIVYQRAQDFSYQVYLSTLKWPLKYQHSLTDQIRRASLSISLNIAEGSGRSNIEFRRFLNISKGSCFECVPIIDLANRLKLIDAKTHDSWYNEALEISRMISGLRSKLSKS